ncbi:MAG: LysR family transcriptional regulator [Hominenteromicrobium sp.]
MTFEQLEAFLAAAQAETFLDAAETLHISQSALSKQIMKLEKELDLRLFDRSRRSASLNDAGRAFQSEAQRLLTQYRAAMRRMELFRADGRETLHVGTLPVLAQYRLTGRLRDFAEAYPGVRLALEELEEQALLDGLEQRRFDVIIARKPMLDMHRHRFFPLAGDRLAAVLPAEHPLARGSAVSVEALRNERLILMHPYTSIYRVCTAAFRKAGIEPRISRTARMESIIGAVAEGEGISLLPQSSFELFQHAGLAAVPLDPPPEITIGLACRRSDAVAPAAAAFLRVLGAEEQ